MLDIVTLSYVELRKSTLFFVRDDRLNGRSCRNTVPRKGIDNKGSQASVRITPRRTAHEDASGLAAQPPDAAAKADVPDQSFQRHCRSTVR